MPEYLVRVLSEFLSLNLAFFFEVVINNLLWVFIFAMMAYFLLDPKKLVANTILVSVYLYAFTSLIIFIGWSFSALYLFLNFCIQCFIRIFIPEHKRFSLILSGAIYLLLFYVNVGAVL
ncbi:MAG: hypothetical protein COT15_02330 [Candidatus Diapherotrites archaeon CG08_land_8_20_14_0_20_34_12]|nr:MAG: hypothetical protein COT15_02330 [Candidatus Diapherotrites archaeon CG08_land_8_20_14_0_20_34_12]